MRNLAIFLGISLAALAATAAWRVDAGGSVLEVEVAKDGLFGHDHRFRADAWTASLTFDPAQPAKASVEVEVEAASLHDHQPKLSKDDAAEVDATTHGPAVLDAEHHPKLRWVAREIALKAGENGTFAGTADGALTLRGVTKPVPCEVSVRVEDGVVHATGSARVRQSDFGITPISKFGGVVAVRDEVTIRFTLVAHRGD